MGKPQVVAGLIVTAVIVLAVIILVAISFKKLSSDQRKF